MSGVTYVLKVVANQSWQMFLSGIARRFCAEKSACL